MTRAPQRGLRRAIGYADLARRGYALKRAEEDQVRHNARAHLAARLGKLRGLPQKVGQLLSLSSDPEVAEAFRPLTAPLEPLPLEAVEAQLAAAWGCDPAEVLDELQAPGIAASLGQVHRGRLRDGTEVAIKVQYPGIRGALEQDLKALGWLSAPVGDLRQGFDLEGYRAEVRRDLDEELDYVREAQAQERMAAVCAHEPCVIPRVHSAWVRPTVLVSSWEEGETLEQVTQGWSDRARSDVAFELVRFFSRTVLGEGFFHADPHEGNYRFQATPQGPRLVVYDFGSTFELTRRERLLLLRMIQSAADRAEDDPLGLLVGLGFDAELLAPLAAKLPALLTLLLLPYRQPTQFDASEWNLGERVADVLGDDRWNFRIAAPARLVFLMRAWHGLRAFLQRLSRPVSWRVPAEPFLLRDGAEAAALELPRLPRTTSFTELAAHLRVQVSEGGRIRVKVSLPASAVDRMEELIEPEVLERIAAAGVDVGERKREIRRRAYAPQEVFQDRVGERVLRVWLE